MQITLTFDTDNLTPGQQVALGSLVGIAEGSAVETPAPAKATPAKKAAAKPEPTPDPEPAEDEASEATLEDAVALATKMVSNGEAKKVKAALSDVGAKKVSEIPADKVGDFVAALS
jgi:hypothetical protein